MKTMSLIAAVLLAGCAGVSRTNTGGAVYDFGQPARSISDVALKERGQMALEVRAAPWLDAPHIDYRLAYEDPLKRRQYA